MAGVRSRRRRRATNLDPLSGLHGDWLGATTDIPALSLRGDSLVNGVAIGGGVGAVTGAVAGALLAALVCENACAGNGVAFVGATTVTGTAIGGLLGAIIDAVKR